MFAMKYILVAAYLSLAACLVNNGGTIVKDAAVSCVNQDLSMRALLQAKVTGPECEDMCKKIGAYPDCDCPGFNGQPASAGDSRSCYDNYCQDPDHPCPTENFRSCVAETTRTAALLQWDTVFKQVDQKFNMVMKLAQAQKACNSKEFGMLALLQAKAVSRGPDCEKMCRDVGAYPNCQCPGFNGMPASADDARGCYTKYCQGVECPTDAFVSCVKESTAFLQWQQVFQHVSSGFDSMLEIARLSRSHNITKMGAGNAYPVKK
jgi:hypothetical protein